MQQLESVGWVKVQKKESNQLTELDVDEIFKMIDVDKSGSISRSVSTDTKRNFHSIPFMTYHCMDSIVQVFSFNSV